MDNILLISITSVMISLLGIVFLLSKEHKKLRQDHSILKDHLERFNEEIAGLNSAVDSVDARLLNNNEQLKGIEGKVTDLKQYNQQSPEPLHNNQQPTQLYKNNQQPTQLYKNNQQPTQLYKNNQQPTQIYKNNQQPTQLYQNNPESPQPYHDAIQKVREGANAEELIQQCGLTQEEATLLIRLHRN